MTTPEQQRSDDMDRFDRLSEKVEAALEAKLSHVRKVISIGRGDEPQPLPPEAADNAWFEEYHRLEAAYRDAQAALDEHIAGITGKPISGQ